MKKALAVGALLFLAFITLNWGLHSATASYSIVPPAPSVYAQGLQGTANIPLQGQGTQTIANVPFFSQFADIQSPAWQPVGCGITSLAMMIDFYRPNTVSVNNLLQQGIDAGAYDPVRGWSFEGLIQLGQEYGLAGNSIDLSELNVPTAIARLENYAKNGPLIFSVHDKFNAANDLPHLVVVDGVQNNTVYYNDPAAKTGEKKISIANFVNGWEGRGIVLRPARPAANQLGMVGPGSALPGGLLK